MKREYIEKVRKIEISFMSFCLLALLTVLVSCEDWLDVRPKSQVKEEIFFESEDGFRDATLGIYTIMSSTSLYGGEATMAFLDVLAQQYSSVGQNYKQAMQYNYADDGCKTRFDRMWTTAYSGVANCNYILKNLQEKGRVMPDSLRRLVQGETMAARTYLLFDMIRAYAPSYKTGMDSLAVPLVREVTNSPVTPTTVSASLDVLINDLEEARELVKDIDPLGPAKTTYSELPESQYWADDYLADDGFWLFRTSRFNYYGMTALLARICLYKEDMSRALLYAQEVINRGKFQLINDKIMSDEQLSFPSVAECMAHHEYITSLYIYDLKRSHNDLYYLDSQAALTISNDRKTEIFGGYGLDFDFRVKRLFSIPSGNAKEYINKYMTGTQIPLLKLGEMYLIAAEASGDIEYLKTFRRMRGYNSNPLPDGEDLIAELQKEYQREFIGEGQLFFYYKRRNIYQIPNTLVPTTQDIYVFPLPDQEIEFGYSNSN